MAEAPRRTRTAQCQHADPDDSGSALRSAAIDRHALLRTDGQRYVVASFAGKHQHPAWYLNLVADPHVTAEVHGELTRGVARVLDRDEAVELWPFLDESYHGFQRYRRRTNREIPIVQIVPEAGAPAVTAI